MPDESTAFRAPEDTPTFVPGERARLLQLSPGTVLGGRYRIVSLVGGGGMGEVYRADDLKLGQTVALKFLLRRGNPDAESRLVDEVRLGRQVSHPNVCRLYDISDVDGLLFITMEFIDGEDLASLLRRIGQLPTAKATSVAREICAGLAAAHASGVIHRDLKPANVMLDGRGRARITDFGVAVAEESAGESVAAGTTAYMAPEQLAGKSATQKSDIYALGLVLYEIFTGKRAFNTKNVAELVRQQESMNVARPSSIAPGIAPSVERVILQCLDPHPESRPDSVEEVVRQLPGYDPLAAAVQAGETPSPAMVAAAETAAELSPIAGWSLLFFVIAGVFASIAVSGMTMWYRRFDLKPPEVLLDRARQAVAAAGIDTRGDWSSIYDDSLARGMYFLYRQSPQPLLPQRADRRVLATDPPFTQPGMADVLLDASGRLIELSVVPPRHETVQVKPLPTWSRLFDLAGIDSSRLKPAPPEWRARVDSDEKHAWLTPDGKRIEAAAFHGRPVWFSTELTTPTPPSSYSTGKQVANSMVIFFLILLPAAALLIARRNLNRGRGDRRGAMRFAIFIFLAAGISAALRAHHVAVFVPEWQMASRIVADSTFWAFMSWIIYIAIEPLARRRWPQMLIGWTRLLQGRFRDPVVGRDLLVGAASGVFVAVMWQATALIPRLFGSNPSLHLRGLPLGSPFGSTAYVSSFLISNLIEATLRSLGVVTFLLLVSAVIRNRTAAVAIAVALMAASFLFEPVGPISLRIAYAAITALVVVIVMFRFGILALSATAYTLLIFWSLPLTLDPDAWYFGRSLVGLLLISAIAATGFALAISGKRWLPRLAFD
jgi:tRNA A-37 threonylcarbamoyl transferase component Bud32